MKMTNASFKTLSLSSLSPPSSSSCLSLYFFMSFFVFSVSVLPCDLEFGCYQVKDAATHVMSHAVTLSSPHPPPAVPTLSRSLSSQDTKLGSLTRAGGRREGRAGQRRFQKQHQHDLSLALLSDGTIIFFLTRSFPPAPARTHSEFKWFSFRESRDGI